VGRWRTAEPEEEEEEDDDDQAGMGSGVARWAFNG